MPLIFVRPANIGSSMREPVPGWVDNVSAAGAAFLLLGLGMFKFMPGDPSRNADIVPCDIVCNAIILAACVSPLPSSRAPPDPDTAPQARRDERAHTHHPGGHVGQPHVVG